MLFKTLLVIFIFYMLVKFLSRFFLQNPNKKGGNFSFFYQTFKNVRQQQKQQQERQQKNPSQNNNIKKDNLDNIEEAEYEEITDDDSEK